MNTIPILQKAIDIIHEIAADEGGGLAAKHLSLSLGIAPATTYRILRTLAGNDWLRETRRGEFQLAFGLARVTRSYARVEHALSLLRRPLRELTERTGLSAKVSIREGMQVVTALRAESRRPNSISSPIGSRMHLLDSGSVGVSLMARLPKNEVMRILKSTTNAGVAEELVLREIAAAKKAGYSSAFGTRNPAIHAMSVALPLTGSESAALTIVGWPEDFSDARRQRECLRALKDCAAQMQMALKGDGASSVSPSPF
ncbi:IclR family transcriptional regulator [Geminisphaera colitermitum]|uniref:IclR family transcriptional regulator n=1 Tax=Geminisphaera colitermitum TaxID=1148786 RepID=UPI0001965370|nr:helix-turn-helix domain-containing protein [Geminisphaera colitermitum]